MKRNAISKPVLILLVSGLLLTSVVPALSRYFPMPDFMKGFLSGLGITLEVIALIKSQRDKKAVGCTASNANDV